MSLLGSRSFNECHGESSRSEVEKGRWEVVRGCLGYVRGSGDVHNNISLWVSEWVKVTQSCPTLCDSMDCSLPGSSIHGILQLFPSPGSSSQPRDWAQVSHFAGGFFTIWTTRKAQYLTVGEKIEFTAVELELIKLAFHFHCILYCKTSFLKLVLCVCVCVWQD